MTNPMKNLEFLAFDSFPDHLLKHPWKRMNLWSSALITGEGGDGSTSTGCKLVRKVIFTMFQGMKFRDLCHFFQSITAITASSRGLAEGSEIPVGGIFCSPSPIDSGLRDGSVGRNGPKETHRHVAPA